MPPPPPPPPPKPFIHPITHAFHGCFNFRRHPTKPPVNRLAYTRVILAKLLLEVCGASGAIWGSSEIFFLRDTPLGNEIVRIVAMFVGVIFFYRFWWHAKHYYQHDQDFPPLKEHHRRKWKLPFLQVFASKLVLEVLGGAGDIWGCSEAVTLRNATNKFSWRVAAAAVGYVFFIRWVFQVFAYCLCFAGLWSNPASFRMTLARWYDAFVSKLVLEVFGAAGAVWGFSEIVFLRTPDTVYIWRPIAITIGVVFTLRWIFALKAFVQSENDAVEIKSQLQPTEMQRDEVANFDVEKAVASDEHIDDLELEETHSGETEASGENENGLKLEA
mmetsp:Transcript_26421/g.54472  ORF Transcript_26421/g.54472 Transcript_26421/m.54472 type:complete len:329 (-) Transcript_26421:66-1052(-)